MNNKWKMADEIRWEEYFMMGAQHGQRPRGMKKPDVVGGLQAVLFY